MFCAADSSYNMYCNNSPALVLANIMTLKPSTWFLHSQYEHVLDGQPDAWLHALLTHTICHSWHQGGKIPFFPKWSWHTEHTEQVCLLDWPGGHKDRKWFWLLNLNMFHLFASTKLRVYYHILVISRYGIWLSHASNYPPAAVQVQQLRPGS